MKIIYEEKELNYMKSINNNGAADNRILFDESCIDKQYGLQFVVKDPIKADIFIATLLSKGGSSLEEELGIKVKQLDLKPGMSATGIRELRDKICKVIEEYL